MDLEVEADFEIETKVEASIERENESVGVNVKGPGMAKILASLLHAFRETFFSLVWLSDLGKKSSSGGMKSSSNILAIPVLLHSPLQNSYSIPERENFFNMW